MSLPPALLQRLAQRGLVQKRKQKETESAADNEEVIAEDYDEMDTEALHGPEGYEHETRKARNEENFWLERMKARMSEGNSVVGYKGCPNKYNIWHKCTLFCVNRWAEGHAEPSREYMRRYKRLLRKYPLPKDWTEVYDPGCGCYFFSNATDNVVSWLPPTHPKSQITKSAAAYRRQMEESNGESPSGGGGGDGGSDGEQQSDDDNDEQHDRENREIDDIINSAIRPRSPPTGHDFPSLQDGHTAAVSSRKQKSRDLDRTLSRQRRDRGREMERERDRDRDRDRYSNDRGRRHGRENVDSEALDPMDPSAYSDIPRGKWSDGLHTGSDGNERKRTADEARERSSGTNDGRDRRDERSDDED